MVDQTIEKVSFCAPDRNHEKGFSYICRDGTTRRWMCHGFLALRESVRLSCCYFYLPFSSQISTHFFLFEAKKIRFTVKLLKYYWSIPNLCHVNFLENPGHQNEITYLFFSWIDMESSAYYQEKGCFWSNWCLDRGVTTTMISNRKTLKNEPALFFWWS